MDEQVIIKWFRKNQWGRTCEYIHPDNGGTAQVLTLLTGKPTINATVRELVRDLTRGHIDWQEVIAP